MIQTVIELFLALCGLAAAGILAIRLLDSHREASKRQK